MKFIVSTVDLRLGLRAVVPHVHRDKDAQWAHRVRVEVCPENVTVSATNGGYTAGLALVSLWDNEDGELGVFDLSPTDVKEILALFHGKAGGDDEAGDTLRVEVDEKHLVVTDISGLFPGKSLTLPRLAVEDNFPDVAALIASKLTKGRKQAARLITSGELLGLFTKAAAAYGASLVIDPCGEDAAMVVSCGESFVGVLMPNRQDEAQTALINSWHADWLIRIQDRKPPEVKQ